MSLEQIKLRCKEDPIFCAGAEKAVQKNKRRIATYRKALHSVSPVTDKMKRTFLDKAAESKKKFDAEIGLYFEASDARMARSAAKKPAAKKPAAKKPAAKKPAAKKPAAKKPAAKKPAAKKPAAKKKPRAKRLANTWVQATKEWNKGKDMYCIPKRGTAGYQEVRAIADGLKAIKG